MNSVARTIRTRIPLLSFTARGMWWFLAIAGLILAIIYLPDFVGFNVHRAPVIDEQVDAPREASPLDQILTQVNEMNAQKPGQPSLRELANETLRGHAINWELISSEPVKAALSKARTQSVELLDSLPLEKTYSKFALSNYIQGLDQLLAGKEDRFSPTEALAYIRYLDREVSNRFNEEKVDTVGFKAWEKISLGEALKIAENRPYRENAFLPFDPDFTLNLVTIHRVPPSTKLKASDFIERTQLTFEGSIRYRGIRKVTLLHNNQVLEELKVPKPGKRSTDPYVFVTAHVTPIAGIFSFRIESEDEEVITKQYQFYPRIMRLAENPNANDFSAGRGFQRIPKLDQFFLIRTTRPEEGTEGMVAF